MPGVPAAAVGSQVSFTGTDTLRVAGGQIAEYWANADMLQLLQQLGVLAPLNQAWRARSALVASARDNP